MAENNQMSYADAENMLMSNIYAPVFFEKLATDYGIRPSNEAEALELLRLAGKLQHLDALNESKQANDRSSTISAASKSLDGLLGDMGVQNSGYVDAEVKEAAVQLAKLPQIRNAALIYQDGLKQQLNQ
jgi:hypothetical protein